MSEKTSDEKTKDVAKWLAIGAGVVAVVTIMVGLVTGGGESEPTYSPPSTTEDFTGSDGAPLSNAERQLVAQVDAIYPGIGEPRYIVNWSEYLCDDIDDGMSGDALIERAIFRYSGGSRPDPTPTQAEQIVAVIESSGFCGTL